MVADSSAVSYPPLLACLVALLGLESVALIALVAWMIVLQIQLAASDPATGLALVVVGALCALWLVLTTFAAARRRSWMRGSSITWHLLVLAVAIGSFAGITATVAIGWLLLVVALVGVGLVITPSVTRATARREQDEHPEGDES